MKKIYPLLGIFIIIIFLNGCSFLNFSTEKNKEKLIKEKVSENKIEQTDKKEYYETENYKLHLPYPVLIKKEKDYVNFSHTIPSFSHYDFCDFKGDSPSKNTFRDFNLTIYFENLNLTDSLLKYGGKFLQESITENLEIIEQEGFLEKISFSNYSGYKLSMGIEGCGIDQYFLKTEKGTLIIQKDFVPELTELNPEKEKFTNLDNVLTPEKSKQIFQEIIESIVIKK